MDLMGATLGQYEIIEQIGRGGTAFVYKAIHRPSERCVALKVLLPHRAQSANFAARFEREARIVAQLDHPNILPIMGFGQEGGLSYIAMPYVGGETLKERLRESLPGLEFTVHIIAQIAAALDHAHQRGILHRDIKPSNILLDEAERVYLTDFGLTKVLTEEDDDLTGSGIGLGTPTYISPEQGQGLAVDHHTDLYSLGAILYEMITGAPPFRAKSPMATIFKHIHSPPRSPRKINPNLPPAIETVIFKALAKMPANRYHSGAEMAGALWQALFNPNPDQSKATTAAEVATSSVVKSSVTTPHHRKEPPPRPELEPASHSTATLFHNLPLPSTPFIGRTKELSEIISHLTNIECRILNVVGPGGIGKTRLAIQAARQIAAAIPVNLAAPFPNKIFTHGIYFVPLSPLKTIDQLVPAIAEGLKFSFYDGQADDQAPKSQLFNYLREKNMLLILDNFEHLLAGVDLLIEILDQAPGIKILATSRERLNLRGEWVLEISGLNYPEDPVLRDVESVESYEATRLFLQNVRRTQIGYELPQEEIPHLIRICQLVEGMPLALEIASSWLRLLTCGEIAAEIEENLDFLSSSLYDIPERHRNLRGVCEYSWNLLSEMERIIFRKLAVFRGGFRREGAAQITGASLRLLSSLMDKSFLRRTAAGRYQIHQVLRQFGEEKLYDVPRELIETQARHSRYYAEFLQQREKHLQEQRQGKALQEIGEEIENIQAAWNRMIEQGKTREIGQALGGLYHFYAIRSWLQEGVDSFGRAADRVREVEGMMHAFKEGPGTIYCRLLARQGQFYYRLRNYGKARELLQKSITISLYLKAQSETAFSLNSLGNIAHRLGETEEAKQLYEESLSIYRNIQDRWGIAISMSHLGVVVHELGGQAKALYEESLEIFKALGDQWGIARILNHLGVVAYARGEYKRAQCLYEESLAICREIADQYGIARSLANLGDLAYLQGNYVEARSLHRESLDIFSEIGDRWGRATSLAHLGDIARALGEAAEAKALFQQSLAISKELDNQREVASALNQLGRIAHTGGSYEEAQKLYRQSLTICRKISNHWGIVTALTDLGGVACSLGDYPAARRYFTQALQTARAMNAHPQILIILVGLATLLANTGGKDEAVALLSLLEDHLRANKETADQADQLLATLKAGLTPHTFAEARRRGQASTIEGVVEEILAWEP